MIDRPSRDKLVLALRRYAAGRTTNDELESAVGNSEDRAISAVEDMAWRLYDDMVRHRATGRHALSREMRRMLARWVVFLRTDCEYAWPSYALRQSENALGQSMLDLFTGGRSSLKKRQEWQAFVGAGDFEVWPFLHKRDEESVRRRTSRLLPARADNGR